VHTVTNKSERVRTCLQRAGLPRLPPGDDDDLGACGLDSLLCVMAVVELQKEFEILIPASAITNRSFDSVRELSALIPD
jgi:D-alanine--poly(phosphoribitol) ligase subunit 2